jgi:AcrR family transcriptional regulator
MSNELTKRKLVEVTYDILLNEGIQEVKARKIAQKAGCTATVIYKYFDNLDYLITVSSMRFLDEYNEKMSAVVQEKGDSIALNKKGWKIFIEYAFQNPIIFERLFWGKGRQVYEDALMEYYLLFPENLQAKAVAYFCITAFTANIEERDFIWLRRAANENLLYMEDAVYISRVNSFIVHGMLLEYVEKKKDPGTAEKTAQETYSLVEKTIDTYVLLKTRAISYE